MKNLFKSAYTISFTFLLCTSGSILNALNYYQFKISDMIEHSNCTFDVDKLDILKACLDVSPGYISANEAKNIINSLSNDDNKIFALNTIANRMNTISLKDTYEIIDGLTFDSSKYKAITSLRHHIKTEQSPYYFVKIINNFTFDYDKNRSLSLLIDNINDVTQKDVANIVNSFIFESNKKNAVTTLINFKKQKLVNEERNNRLFGEIPFTLSAGEHSTLQSNIKAPFLLSNHQRLTTGRHHRNYQETDTRNQRNELDTVIKVAIPVGIISLAVAAVADYKNQQRREIKE